MRSISLDYGCRSRMLLTLFRKLTYFSPTFVLASLFLLFPARLTSLLKTADFFTSFFILQEMLIRWKPFVSNNVFLPLGWPLLVELSSVEAWWCKSWENKWLYAGGHRRKFDKVLNVSSCNRPLIFILVFYVVCFVSSCLGFLKMTVGFTWVNMISI